MSPIEVEDALLIEADEREPVVVPVDVYPGGLPELDGRGHVGNGRCRGHADADTADQPVGTDPADLDLVVAMQRRQRRSVSNLTAGFDLAAINEVCATNIPRRECTTGRDRSWTAVSDGARTVGRVKIDVLSVPDCPTHAIAVSRIIEALRAGSLTGVEISARVITNDADDHALGMQGSPTILIDGRDPFVEAGTSPSMSCRLYRSAAGFEGAPSVAELIAALTR